MIRLMATVKDREGSLFSLSLSHVETSRVCAKGREREGESRGRGGGEKERERDRAAEKARREGIFTGDFDVSVMLSGRREKE
jgi:hypothetical protein